MTLTEKPDGAENESRRAWCEMFALWYARHQGVELVRAERSAEAAYDTYSTLRPLTALQTVLCQPALLSPLGEAPRVARDAPESVAVTTSGRSFTGCSRPRRHDM